MILLLALIWAPLVAAWSFNISSRVAQCAALSITWDGGVAPWEIILIPVGELQGPEIRTIVDANVTSGNTYSFQLKFPTGSSFLAMMNDATGIGTGGTSDLITVLDGDPGCLATSATTPRFFLYLAPQQNPPECSSMQIGWQAENTQGPVRITAMIPGGTSFALPIPATGSQFNTTVDIKAGTEFLVVAGDSRGFGTGGSSQLITVADGGTNCINAQSPSSTMAPAAGGIYATGSGGGSVTGVAGGGPQPSSGASNSGGSHKSNVGPIVGGVVGGIALLAILGLLLLFCLRRRRLRRQREAGIPAKGRKREDVDLLNGEPGTGTVAAGGSPNSETTAAEHGALAAGGAAAAGTAMREHHRNQPSVSTTADTNATSALSPGPLSASSNSRRGSAPSIPPLNFGSGAEESEISHETGGTARAPFTRTSSGVPPSAFFNSSNGAGGGRPTTPTSSAARSGKGPVPGTGMRPVNVIVHDDAGQVPQAGPSPGPGGDVVELPPSYADVRRSSNVGH